MIRRSIQGVFSFHHAAEWDNLSPEALPVNSHWCTSKCFANKSMYLFPLDWNYSRRQCYDSSKDSNFHSGREPRCLKFFMLELEAIFLKLWFIKKICLTSSEQFEEKMVFDMFDFFEEFSNIYKPFLTFAKPNKKCLSFTDCLNGWTIQFP